MWGYRHGSLKKGKKGDRPHKAPFRGGTAPADGPLAEQTFVAALNVKLVIHRRVCIRRILKRLRESWDHYEIFGIVPELQCDCPPGRAAAGGLSSWTSRAVSALIPGTARQKGGVSWRMRTEIRPVRRPASPAAQPQRSGRQAAGARADYSRTTRDVQVSVRSFFLADQSQPDENHFVWAYRVQDREPGARAGAVAAPHLADHRCARPHAARARRRRGRRAAAAGTGRELRIHLRHAPRHASGFMVGAYHMVSRPPARTSTWRSRRSAWTARTKRQGCTDPKDPGCGGHWHSPISRLTVCPSAGQSMIRRKLSR